MILYRELLEFWGGGKDWVSGIENIIHPSIYLFVDKLYLEKFTLLEVENFV